jgi:hypothetical protein
LVSEETSTVTDQFPEVARLSPGEIREILGRPNGPFVLLDLCRDGRITPEATAAAIEGYRARSPGRIGRRFVMLIEALFGQ